MNKGILFAPYINLKRINECFEIRYINTNDSTTKMRLTIINVKELLRNIIFANDSEKKGIIPPRRTIPVNTVAPNKSM